MVCWRRKQFNDDQKNALANVFLKLQSQNILMQSGENFYDVVARLNELGGESDVSWKIGSMNLFCIKRLGITLKKLKKHSN